MKWKKHKTQDSKPQGNQNEYMYEVLEKLQKELDGLELKPPTLLTDEIDICGD